MWITPSASRHAICRATASLTTSGKVYGWGDDNAGQVGARLTLIEHAKLPELAGQGQVERIGDARSVIKRRRHDGKISQQRQQIRLVDDHAAAGDSGRVLRTCR